MRLLEARDVRVGAEHKINLLDMFKWIIYNNFVSIIGISLKNIPFTASAHPIKHVPNRIKKKDGKIFVNVFENRKLRPCPHILISRFFA